jgi:hypothetical protein
MTDGGLGDAVERAREAERLAARAQGEHEARLRQTSTQLRAAALSFVSRADAAGIAPNGRLQFRTGETRRKSLFRSTRVDILRSEPVWVVKAPPTNRYDSWDPLWVTTAGILLTVGGAGASVEVGPRLAPDTVVEQLAAFLLRHGA